MIMNVLAQCNINRHQILLNNNLFFSDSNNENAKDFLIEAYRMSSIDYPKFFKMDNQSKAGFLAASLMLQNTQFDNADPKHDFGIILENNVSSLDTDYAYQRTIDDPQNYFPSPALFVYTLSNIVAGEIAIKYKIFGETTFFINKNYDEKRMYQYVNVLFTNNILKTAIIGWVNCLNEICEVKMQLVDGK